MHVSVATWEPLVYQSLLYLRQSESALPVLDAYLTDH